MSLLSSFRRRIAPLALLVSPGFWLREWGMSLALGFGILSALVFILLAVAPPLIVPLLFGSEPLAASPVSAALTAAIFVLTFGGGMLVAVDAHAHLNREDDIGTIIDRSIDSYRGRPRGENLGWTVNQMADIFIPEKIEGIKGNSRHSVHGRLLKIIQAETENLRYDPVQTLIERTATGGDRRAFGTICSQ